MAGWRMVLEYGLVGWLILMAGLGPLANEKAGAANAGPGQLAHSATAIVSRA
jgi:hypothetical protein